MNPADLGFTLEASKTNILRSTEYCIYGSRYQLVHLYYTLIQLASDCPLSQNEIWIGDIEVYQVYQLHFDKRCAKESLHRYQDSFWHFINPKSIKFVPLMNSTDEEEYGLYFHTIGYGFSGAQMIKDLVKKYYNQLQIAYKDIAVSYGKATTIVADKKKKYFE